MNQKIEATASKRAIQKTAEATGDLIGNKIADKITSISKSPQNNLDKTKRTSKSNNQQGHIIPRVTLNLKLQCQSLVYAIIVMHIYIYLLN